MPVVINELHVRVNVEEEKKDRSRRVRSGSSQINRDAIVNTCVEKVLEIIKQESRR